MELKVNDKNEVIEINLDSKDTVLEWINYYNEIAKKIGSFQATKEESEKAIKVLSKTNFFTRLINKIK